jgi:hypothetical protein
MKEQSLKILAESRRLLDEESIPSAERDILLRLIDILAASLEKYSDDRSDPPVLPGT